MRNPRLKASFLTLFLILTATAGLRAESLDVPRGLALELFASGFEHPLAVRHANDGSGRIFVVEKEGRIWALNRHGVRDPKPLLDIRDLVDSSKNEQGLLGLAFHPDVAANGYFYVDFTRDPPPAGDSFFDPDLTSVMRFQIDPYFPGRIRPGSGVRVLEFAQPFGNHNGGELAFGPDGLLYIGTGDGGSSNDPRNLAQDRTSLLGKILRIDVDDRSRPLHSMQCGRGSLYGIPAGNPLAGSPEHCSELWSIGLRNPFRFSFDRVTGDLLIGDVGQGAVEEIDFQPASASGGGNYGWDCLEGTRDNRAAADDPACTPLPSTIAPVLEHLHPDFRSITGGYVYRGPESVMQGYYVYGDFTSGQIWLARRLDNGQWTSRQWRDTDLFISSFGEDEQGNLYVVDYVGGNVFRFASVVFGSGFE